MMRRVEDTYRNLSREGVIAALRQIGETSEEFRAVSIHLENKDGVTEIFVSYAEKEADG